MRRSYDYYGAMRVLWSHAGGTPVVGDIDEVRLQVGGRSLAADGQGPVKLGAQDFEDPVDAIGAVFRQTPVEGAATPTALAPRARAFNTSLPADPRVQVDFAVIIDRVHYLRQHFHGAHGGVNLPAAVRGYQDAVDATFGGDVGILSGPYALEHQGQTGEIAQPVQFIPG